MDRRWLVQTILKVSNFVLIWQTLANSLIFTFSPHSLSERLGSGTKSPCLPCSCLSFKKKNYPFISTESALVQFWKRACFLLNAKYSIIQNRVDFLLYSFIFYIWALVCTSPSSQAFHIQEGLTCRSPNKLWWAFSQKLFSIFQCGQVLLRWLYYREKSPIKGPSHQVRFAWKLYQ